MASRALKVAAALLALATGPAPRDEGRRAPSTNPPPGTPFEVEAVMRRAHFSFRQEGDRFTGGHSTYAVEAGAGRLRVSPVPQQAVVGRPLVVETRSIGRGPVRLQPGGPPALDHEGRLVRRGAAVTETTENRSEGVEVSWTFPAEPEGTGDLVVRVAASGLDYAGETAGGLHFADRESRLGLRYGHATWIAAGGERTPVRARWDGREIVIAVPARVVEASAYPAVLDPVIGPEHGLDSPVTGPAAGDQSKTSVAHSGTTFMVVWLDSRSPVAPQVFGARLDASGAVLDPNGILLSAPFLTASDPSVVWDGTDFLVVFQSLDVVYGRRVSSGGAIVDASAFAISSGGPAVTPFAHGNGSTTFVAWESAGDIFGTRVTGSTVDAAPIAISTAPGDQRAPRVTYGGGRWFVVWHDMRGATLDVYGARVEQGTGALLDAASTGIAISTADFTQWEPWPASDGTDYFVVWTDWRNIYAAEADVYGARVTSATGTVVDAAGIQLCDDADYQTAPAVAYTGGVYQVVWQDARPGGGLYGNRVTPAGAVAYGAAGARLDASMIAASVIAPRVYAAGAQFYVGWSQDLGEDEGSDVVGSRLTTGSALLDGAGVSLSVSGNAQREVAVAGDGSNNYLVVWVDERGGVKTIYGARVDGATGESLDPAGMPLSIGYNESAPAVAHNGTEYLVVWTEGFGGIAGTRVSNTGTVLDPASLSLFQYPAVDASSPQVASDGDSWFVVWSDTRAGGINSPDIYGGRVSAAGASLDPSGILISNADYGQERPRVGFGGGYYLAVWYDYRYLFGRDLYGARISTAGVVQEPTATNLWIGPATGDVGNGEYAVAYANGNFVVPYSSNLLRRARVVAATGASVDDVALTGSSVSGAAIAYDQDTFLVLYGVANPAGGYDVKGTRVNVDGADLDGADWDVVTGGGVPSRGFGIAALGPKGKALAAYSRYDSTPGITAERARTRLVTRIPVADLAVTKNDGVTNVRPGGELTYAVVVANAGPDDVTGATVTDVFPSTLSCATSCVGTGGATCAEDPFAGNIADTVSIPAGQSVTYTSVCAVSLSASGSISNTASAAVPAAMIDPNGGNSSATDTDVVTPVVDLSVTKTDNQVSSIPGSSVTYTITVANAGPNTATGANVTDALPPSLSGATWSCSASSGSSCTAAGTGNIDDTVEILAGGTLTYSLTANVSATASGTLMNTAAAAPPPGSTDSTPADNSATDSNSLAPQADLSVTKTDNKTTVVPGSIAIYTITVTNAGPSAVTGATVTDTLPATLTGATWACSASAGSSCPANGNGSINHSVNLLVGGTLTYTLVATVDPAAPAGPLDNTASVAVPAGATDSNPANDSATDTDTVMIPTLTLGDVSVKEGHSGNTPLSFTVTLSPPAAGTISVSYATQDVTALSGTDYATASGTLTFLAGQTTKPVPVSVLGDTLNERPETFTVTLSGASGAAIGDDTATGTIRDDEDEVVQFDADTRSDLTVFHAASGLWFMRNSTDGAIGSIGFGGPGYAPVPGDYDGDGITDVAAYHPPSGLWFIRNSTTLTTTTTAFGGPDYMPVRGDFDGDGRIDLAVFHDATGLWFIKRSSTGAVDAIGFGATGYLPVPGDYDGDGTTDLAVYHPPSGLWFTRASSTLITTTTGFGGSAYTPVRGDFDGDGRTDLAVFHAGSGLWYIRNSSTSTVDAIGYGAGGGYTPVPGKHDADGKTDVAVYHQASGLWFLRSSAGGGTTTIGFGGTGYNPVN